MAGEDHILKTSALTRARDFELTPDAGARSALAGELGIDGIRKLTLKGEVAPEGSRDLRLEAHLGATVVQACVVTGDPVVTRIEEDVLRRYLVNWEEPEAEEVEMDEDDTIEALPEHLDLFTVMAEALALALPAWPRAEGVEPVELSVTEPGKEAMTDDDAKPFAALKSLRDGLKNGGENEG